MGDLAVDVYTGVMAVLLAVAVLVGSRGVLGDAVGGGSPVEPSGGPAPLLAAVGLLLVVGSACGLLGRLGPLAVPAPQAVWWLPLPVERGGLVRPVVVRRTAAAAAAGGLGAGLVLLLVLGGEGGPGAGALVFLSLVVAAATTLLVAGGGLQQVGTGASRPLVVLGDALALAAPVLLLAGSTGGPGRAPVGVGLLAPSPATSVLAPSALVLTAVAVAAGSVTALLLRRAGAVPVDSLTRAGALSTQVAGAGLLVDTRALGQALADPERTPRTSRWGCRSPRWTRSRLVRGPAAALVVADLLAVLRTPRRLLTPLVVAVVPAGAAAAGTAPWVVVLTVAVCGYAVATVLAEPVRQRVLVPALDAVVPLSAGAAGAVHTGVVAGLATAVMVVMALALLLLAPGVVPLVLVVAAAPALAAAAVRGASRPDPDWAGYVVDTGLGPMPLGVLVGLLRGPDVAVVAALPLAVATPVLAGGGVLPAGAYAVLVVVALLLGVVAAASAAAGARPPVPVRPTAGAGGGAP